MEAVAFDEGSLQLLAAKDLLERTHHRGGTGARGTRDRDDGMRG
jgi:hypothetical protein